MTERHDICSLYIGDDWAIDGTLYDANNSVLDLTSATIEWSLLDPNLVEVINETQATIALTDPTQGKLTISVSDTVTGNLTAGQHSDVLRVTIGDLTDTMWVGTIFVKKGKS
jgi:hypothetical protein